MKKIYTTIFLSAIVAISASSFLTVKSSGGKAGYTNSPGETACNSCHSTYALNSGPGSVSITSNIPGWAYTPNQTYTINVTITHQTMPLFSFGFEALSGSGPYANAGTFIITNSTETQILTKTVDGVSRNNVVHKTNGGLQNNTKTFSFDWTAPPSNAGNITFYVCGLACNAQSNLTGDYAYTASQVVTFAAGERFPTVENTEISVFASQNESKINIMAFKDISRCSIIVANITGQTVYSEDNVNLVKGIRQIDAVNFRKGIYFVGINSREKKQAFKIILN